MINSKEALAGLLIAGSAASCLPDRLCVVDLDSSPYETVTLDDAATVEKYRSEIQEAATKFCEEEEDNETGHDSLEECVEYAQRAIRIVCTTPDGNQMVIKSSGNPNWNKYFAENPGLTCTAPSQDELIYHCEDYDWTVS